MLKLVYYKVFWGKLGYFLGKMVIVEFNFHFCWEIVRFFVKKTFTNMFLKPCSLNVSVLCAAREVFIFTMNLNMETTHGAIFMLKFYSM